MPLERGQLCSYAGETVPIPPSPVPGTNQEVQGLAEEGNFTSFETLEASFIFFNFFNFLETIYYPAGLPFLLMQVHSAFMC